MSATYRYCITMNGTYVVERKKMESCSQVPAIFWLPEPSAWPTSALRTWLNARGGTMRMLTTMSDSDAAARYCSAEYGLGRKVPVVWLPRWPTNAAASRQAYISHAHNVSGGQHGIGPPVQRERAHYQSRPCLSGR